MLLFFSIQGFCFLSARQEPITFPSIALCHHLCSLIGLTPSQGPSLIGSSWDEWPVEATQNEKGENAIVLKSGTWRDFLSGGLSNVSRLASKDHNRKKSVTCLFGLLRNHRYKSGSLRYFSLGQCESGLLPEVNSGQRLEIAGCWMKAVA